MRVSVKEQKDGSAIVKLCLSDKEYMGLFRVGLQLMVGKKFRVVPIEEAKDLGITGKKTYNITDAEADELVKKAVMAAIRNGIKEFEKRGKK